MTLCSQSPNQHSTSNSSPKCTGVNLGTTRGRAAPDLCLWKAKKCLYCFEEERQENAAASTGKNCFPIKERYFYPIKSFVCRTYQIKWMLNPFENLIKLTSRGVRQALLSLLSYAQSPGSLLYFPLIFVAGEEVRTQHALPGVPSCHILSEHWWKR